MNKFWREEAMKIVRVIVLVLFISLVIYLASLSQVKGGGQGFARSATVESLTNPSSMKHRSGERIQVCGFVFKHPLDDWILVERLRHLRSLYASPSRGEGKCVALVASDDMPTGFLIIRGIWNKEDSSIKVEEWEKL